MVTRNTSASVRTAKRHNGGKQIGVIFHPGAPRRKPSFFEDAETGLMLVAVREKRKEADLLEVLLCLLQSTEHRLD